ncbi:hypothetical protein Tco_1256454 [Tanacetum coccineum]
MKKMNEKPGHVRPANGFYEKLNALMFVPQKELSGDQAYWLSANEIASQASKPATPAVLSCYSFRIIKERTTQKPDYVSEWCYDYAKQFVEQQLVPFYDHFKKHIQAANDTFFKEIKEYEYEQCVLDNKNLTIEKKNLLIRNDCLIAECLEKDICSIVLTSDSVVPPSSNCLCEDLRSACDREHTKVLELEAEISKQKQLITESEKRFAFLEQNYKTESGKTVMMNCPKSNRSLTTVYTEKLSAIHCPENTKLKAQVTGTTSSGPSTSETPKVLAPGMYNLELNPLLEPAKLCPKRAPRNHSSLPVKSANARRVEAHHRTLNKKNRVDSNLLVKHSVSVSNLNNVCGACNKSLVFANHSDCLVMCDGSVNVKPHQTKRFKRQPRKEWKPVKKVWKPISKPVANSKPQWKPTGRHFSLFEKHPLTRIMESTDMPIELPPSASSSPQITMVSRFTDHKLSDRKAGSTNCSMRFATLLPLLGVKQMSPETLKELQDESVSERNLLFHVRRKWTYGMLRKEMLYHQGIRMNAHAVLRTSAH